MLRRRDVKVPPEPLRVSFSLAEGRRADRRPGDDVSADRDCGESHYPDEITRGLRAQRAELPAGTERRAQRSHQLKAQRDPLAPWVQLLRVHVKAGAAKPTRNGRYGTFRTRTATRSLPRGPVR